VLVFFVDFLDYELGEGVDVGENAFDKAEFILSFFFL